ncbi:hypothetical protein [Aliarcobacter cryaerophilus]|uniref:Uncharacterized protein n=2 Tax=unclassified Arcobacter TaxID=2593671 RepID=A0AA96CZ44_9BACT|nr:hypothetical protein RJG52_07555 [Arcobacter sp. AZ-2023]WPD10398.1 hypothetical protein QUR77_03295 [Arcobacter sp. DSM 115954]WNL15228.1 hypothetical protein RJG51_03305 [Arcobacter sp. AZ-2023]WNL18890.1 hypothetical protein RJG53_09935 [Arcobacter sp. AZ-2023]WNL21029.1 hypothetical protein RJG56_09815 [Arcobacter sp. AZ-2023]
MSIKKSIPYLSSDYNNILEDFQIEKIRSMGKEELIVCLKNPESWIYDFYLRNSCINLFQRTGGFTGIGLCDDDLYRIGVETTIIQLNKRYFFDLNNDNFLILNKIRSRIVNNIRNYFSPVRRINYTQFNNYLIQIEDSDNIFEKIALERDLEKVDIETLKNGLKKVWENSIVDMDFDLKDFEQLCDKFGLTPLDVLVYNPYILPQMSKEACNNANYQLVLVFDGDNIV